MAPPLETVPAPCDQAVEIRSPAHLAIEEAGRAVAAPYLRRHRSINTATPATPLSLSDSEFRRVRDFIHANLGGKITLTQLADLSGMSVAHFCRRFRNTTGMAPYRYVLQTRIDCAKQALLQRRPLADIALRLGFYDQSQFSNTFRRIVGMTPRAFRRTHRE